MNVNGGTLNDDMLILYLLLLNLYIIQCWALWGFKKLSLCNVSKHFINYHG